MFVVIMASLARFLGSAAFGLCMVRQSTMVGTDDVMNGSAHGGQEVQRQEVA